MCVYPERQDAESTQDNPEDKASSNFKDWNTRWHQFLDHLLHVPASVQERSDIEGGFRKSGMSIPPSKGPVQKIFILFFAKKNCKRRVLCNMDEQNSHIGFISWCLFAERNGRKMQDTPTIRLKNFWQKKESPLCTTRNLIPAPPLDVTEDRSSLFHL